MYSRSSALAKKAAFTAACALLAQPLSAATYTWARGIASASPFSWNNTTLNGDVTNGNNWNATPAGAFPNAVGDVANLSNGAGANNQTINLDQNITIGAISNIGSTNGAGIKTIAAGGAFTLTFDNGASDASISKLNTTNNNASIISAPIAIAGNGNLNIVNSSTNNLTLSGAVSGTNANLRVTTGTGAVLFTGDHTGLSGTFTHSSGTSNSQFNSATSGSQNVAYTISAGELIFAANGNYTVKMGSLSSTAGNIRGGNSATGTATLEVGNLGTSTSIAGNLNNGATKVLALTKVGSGTFTINGTNNFSGGTNVDVGTMLVNGSLTSAANTVAVASGATLGGSGTIAGATTVNGTLSPGNSPGVITFSGDLTLGGTSTSAFEINGATRGTEYDGVDVGGALTYGGTLSLLFDAPIAAGTYDLFGGAFTSPSGTFGSVSVGGTFAETFGAAPTITGSGWTAGSASWNYVFDNNSGDLAISAVPEPSAFAALAGLAGLGVVGSRRRRRA